MNKDDINEARRMLDDLLRSAYDRHLYDNYNGNVEIVFTKKDTYMHYQWLDAALNRLESLEVAFDDACELLERYDNGLTKDQWKETLLRNIDPSSLSDESVIKVPLD